MVLTIKKRAQIQSYKLLVNLKLKLYGIELNIESNFPLKKNLHFFPIGTKQLRSGQISPCPPLTPFLSHTLKNREQMFITSLPQKTLPSLPILILPIPSYILSTMDSSSTIISTRVSPDILGENTGRISFLKNIYGSCCS